MTDENWDVLDGADAIVFGSATYMGNVSAGFQAFAEQTGRRCLNGTWRDKVAAGFTNSGAKAGDKLHALSSLAVFAAQHHMHWVNLGLGAGWNSASGSEDDLNRLGFWLGAGAATDVDVDPDDVHPPTSGRAITRAPRRDGHPAAQSWSSGVSSCSIVGTSSLTVGWMCMVREIAV